MTEQHLEPYDDLIDDLDTMDTLDLPEAQMQFYRDKDIDGFLNEFAPVSQAVETRVLPIRRYPAPKLREVRYERAVDFVNQSPLEDLADGDRYFAILRGTFVFGDMLEAYLFERDHHADEILVATLSMSQNNVDSLAGIVSGGRVRRLGLIVSTYWYAVEMKRRVGYVLDRLSPAEDFSWAAVSLHAKIILMREGDRHYVLHGSANMRSCGQIEQITVERNEQLYNFNKAWMDRILRDFAVRPKAQPLWGDKLWRTVAQEAAARK